ncbi:MAG: hypothetical protein V1899_07865, partial [Planctomycetota bacterium]
MPSGHRALIYVADMQKFIWTVEFLEIVEENLYEKDLLSPWGIKLADLGDTWRYVRPIRFIARMNETRNYEDAPTLKWARTLIGNSKWQPSYGHGHIFIEKTMFSLLFDNIPWDWPDTGCQSSVPAKRNAEANGKENFDHPPVPDIKGLLELIATNKKEERPEADT